MKSNNGSTRGWPVDPGDPPYAQVTAARGGIGDLRGMRPPPNRRRLAPVSESSFYKTERGTIFRLKEDDEGRLSVELLQTSLWVQGPIGMAGLRVAPTTTKLTARQIQSLPQ